MTIIAHRCGDERHPENTLAAARASLSAGADYLEIDVRFTSDAHPVVLHDPDLRRVFGDDRSVDRVTLDEFRSLQYRSDPRVTPNSLDDFLEADLGPFLIHVKLGARLDQLMDHLVERGYRERVILGVTSPEDLATVDRRPEAWRTLGFIRDPRRWQEFQSAEIIRLWDHWIEGAAADDLLSAGKTVWVMTGQLPGYLPVGIFDARRIGLYRRLGITGALVNEPERFSAALRDHPRIVAHRGLALSAAENSIPAFVAARAAGATEVELDIRATADRRLVVSHDASVARLVRVQTSVDIPDKAAAAPEDERKAFAGGRVPSEPSIVEAIAARARSTPIAKLTIDELKTVELAGEQRGVRICTLADVFRELGRSVGYNLHLKEAGDGGWVVARVVDLIRTYRLTHHAYIAGDADVLAAARRIDTEIDRCCLAGQTDGSLLEHAHEFECRRVQFLRGHAPDDEIRRAIELGYLVNYCCTDDPAETERLFALGVQAVLTGRVDLLASAAKG